MFGVLDDFHILLLTQDFQDVQIITKVLRDDIFTQFKEKMEDE